MIEELISTSAPRCLNGNAGFGIVAQTVGMAPNVSLAAVALSGYTHIAPPGSGKNPVVYLHTVRRTGGMLRHLVSRIADCGNDYSGRSNRIAHHWIIAEDDVRSLPGGPAELTAQRIFRSNWNEKPVELPPKKLSVADVSPKKCTVWEQTTGDAGWGGIVAEGTERGCPISIIFAPEHNSETLRTLIGESLALLPPSVRWKITFSTYYMKSHEASGDKIQIKCFLAGSEESKFAKQSPNTVVIDLRQRLGPVPTNQVDKYVEKARGMVNAQPPKMSFHTPIPTSVPLPVQSEPETFELTPSHLTMSTTSQKSRLDYRTGWDFTQTDDASKKTDWFTVKLSGGLLLLILLLLAGFFVCPKLIPKRATPVPVNNVEEQKFEPKNENEPQQQPTNNNNEVPSDPLSENNTGESEKNSDEVNNQSQQPAGQIGSPENRIAGTEPTPLHNEDTVVNEEGKNAESEQKLANQNTAEQKQDDIVNDLQKLPTVWKELVSDQDKLPSSGTISLNLESEFFQKYREKIQLETIHFVDLKNGKINIEKKNESHKKITFTTDNKKFATIELTDENVQFTWTNDNKPKNSAGGAEECQLRILLSKLRITVDGRSHDIALWTPLKAKDSVAPQWREVLDNTSKFEFKSDDLEVHGSLHRFSVLFNLQPEDAENSLGKLGKMANELNKRMSQFDQDTGQPSFLEHVKIYLSNPEENDTLLLMEGMP